MTHGVEWALGDTSSLHTLLLPRKSVPLSAPTPINSAFPTALLEASQSCSIISTTEGATSKWALILSNGSSSVRDEPLPLVGNAKSWRRPVLPAQPGRVPGQGRHQEQRSRALLLQALNSAPWWEKSLCREGGCEGRSLCPGSVLHQLLQEHLQSPPGLQLHGPGPQCRQQHCFPWVHLHPQNVSRCISLRDLTPTISQKPPI